MHSPRPDTLDVAVGVFCLLTGALMLVAPHQFGAGTYALLQPNLPWWGFAFLLAGSALLAAILMHHRWLTAATHLFAAAALLGLAAGSVATGTWTGAANYAVLGLGTAIAGLLAQGSGGGGRWSGNEDARPTPRPLTPGP
ncbi:MAG: hypothetical protein HY331_14185, partial [Chloroflexi bacterium]|nr:hypothetical protein [Chloroflexota bacterium]